LTTLLIETDTPGPLLRAIESLEKERVAAQERSLAAEQAVLHSKALGEITEEDVTELLFAMAESLEDLDRDSLKAMLQGLIERITLDPATLSSCIYYKIPLKSMNKVASPTRFELVLSP
jgi:hypothetical protein